MFQKQFPPVSIIKEDISQFYAITTDIFHVHRLYSNKNVNSNKKSLGFCLLKPNLI